MKKPVEEWAWLTLWPGTSRIRIGIPYASMTPKERREYHNHFYPVEPVPCGVWGDICWVSPNKLARRRPCTACPNQTSQKSENSVEFPL